MCDYSLHHLEARPAIVGAKLESTTFPGTVTCGFCVDDNRACAICLQPGTEIAFDAPIRHYEDPTGFPVTSEATVAIFRQINPNDMYAHHDALELPDGQIVLLTKLCEGQVATVLQLPAELKLAGEEQSGEKAEGWHVSVREPEQHVA